MKLAKFAFVCAAVASLTAVADDAASDMLGIMKVDKPSGLLTVPVGINFAAANGAVSVSNAVKTAGLPSGTLLYAYNGNDMYYVYGISGSSWVTNSSYYVDEFGVMTTTPAVGADALTLPAGSSVFLKLPQELQTGEQIIIAGKPVESSTVTFNDGANLCCFPVGKSVDLNSDSASVATLIKTTPTPTTFGNDAKSLVTTKGDTIAVITADSGASRVYYYDDDTSKWGYIGRANPSSPKKSFIAEAVIPGGVGFWYNKVTPSSPSVGD